MPSKKTELTIVCEGKPAIGEFPAVNGCGRKFVFRGATHIEEMADGVGVERAYVRCPVCMTKYVCGYSNPRITALQKHLKTMLDVPSNAEQRDKVSAMIKEEQELLKAKYGI